MDDRRRKVLIIGLVLAALVGLFPPWERRAYQAESHALYAVIQAGHAPLFLPPKPIGGSGLIQTYNVAYGRLLAYWAIILLGTGAAYLLVGDVPKKGG